MNRKINRLFLYIKNKLGANVDFDYLEFIKNWARWRKLSISDYNYRFTYESGLGFFEVDLKVRNNKLVSAIESDGTNQNKGFYKDLTIPVIFNEIDKIFRQPYVEKYSRNHFYRCSEIEINYHPDFFFPVQYRFFYEGRNMGITDMANNQLLSDFERV